ncbi:MAG TPA: tetratricopeptide repeat protein, partial [Hyphomicrobiales bacterium]|nr:tetratricopeptide repeat protein [Hyphomicrobiales bacterium]
DYDQAIANNPSDAEAHNNRGLAHARSGNLDEALADYDRAIEIDPDYAEAYNNRGLAHYRKGALGPALDDLTRAETLLPAGSPQRSKARDAIAEVERLHRP